MFAHDFVDVHVDNLASLEVFVEESHHDVFCLGHGGKEFFFSNLLVGATAHRPVDLFLLVVGFHGFVASLLERFHDFFRFLVHHIIQLIIKIRSFVLILVAVVVVLVVFFLGDLFALSVQELLLHHSGLVFDGFLHDHL